MSTVYVLEPPTKGKVILTTSYGALDVELWPKEAPKAVRNFVQLCLEGYYNYTIFHRIIKSFIVQGGDPTGTGEGGESAYGNVFADEFHSRLRFKHRGLVACAGSGTPNSNGSQFFMTLDRCDCLDKKHTIFGKVTGDSIYNLLNLSELETGRDDRPWDPPPKILSVEVLWNPFDDIVPRTLLIPAPTSEKNGTKQKVTKRLNLLSFGEEAEEDEKEIAADVNARIKSSHDVLNDRRLLKEEGLENDLKSDEVRERKAALSIVREALSSKREHRKESETGFFEPLDYRDDDDDEASFDARMRQQILRKRIELGDLPTWKGQPIGSRNHVESLPRLDVDNHDADLQLLGAAERERQLKKKKKRRRQAQENEMLAILEKFRSSVFSTKSEGDLAIGLRNHVESPPRSIVDNHDERPKKCKLSLKRKGIGTEARAELMAYADADLELLGAAQAERQLKKQKKRRRQRQENEMLAKLEKFTTSVFSTNSEVSNREPDLRKDDDDVSDWTQNMLKFAPEPSKNNMSRSNDPNDYVVHDPLLEKGKEKFNKVQAKIKRRQREWAGRSLT